MTSRSYKSKLVVIVAIAITAVASAGAQCVQPPDTTMVAWYPFDEPSGATTSADLAAGNTGAQINGSLGTFPGKVFGAASFNGINQYVQSASTVVNNFGPATNPSPFGCSNGGSACYGNFSIDTWINIPANAPAGVMVILDKRDAATLVGYHFWVYKALNGSQYLGLGLGDAANGYLNYVSFPQVLYTGNWQHVAVTVVRAGTAPKITFYLNGIADLSTNIPAQLGSLVNNSPLRIGTRTVTTPPTGWFFGSLDELEIFNRDLTTVEVSNIFQSGSSGKCKPEQAWTINFGYSVSDSFSATIGPTLTFTYWDADLSDPLTTVDVQIGSTPFGGSIQTLVVTNSFPPTVNSDGFYVYKATVPLDFVSSGYLTLSNACTTLGCSVTPIYWEQYSGTPPATLGILGYTNTNGSLGSCAEPDPVTGCPPNPIPPESFF